MKTRELLLAFFVVLYACAQREEVVINPQLEPKVTEIISIDFDPTFTGHVFPILKANCMSCHNPEGSGPFSLITYQQVNRKGKMLKEVTASHYMPPWKADLDYSSFVGERGLSDTEIAVFHKWVDGGMPYGDTSIVLDYTIESDTNELKGAPQLILALDEPFEIPASDDEYFVTYVFPPTIKEEAYVKAFEFIPGNKQVVHHAWLLLDTSQYFMGIESDYTTAEGIKVFQEKNEFHLLDNSYGTIIDAGLLYTPGYHVIPYPEGIARKIPANTAVIFQVHYVSRGKVEKDSSLLNIYFAEEEIDRPAQYVLVEEDRIQNGPLELQPGEIKTFVTKFPPPRTTVSVLKISPHMHYRGRRVEVFAVRKNNDTIPMLKINDWDFNWQGIYTFKHPLKIPTDADIYMLSTFDNTAENPYNPVIPPITVNEGYRSDDEMCQLFIEFVEYREGDEKLEY